MSKTASIANHTIDPRTGFLESQAYSNSFDSGSKSIFLQILTQTCFRVQEACDKMGISYHTFQKHCEKDAVFMESVQRLKRLFIQGAEQVLAEEACKPAKVLDRIFFLKCWKPSRYNPVNKLESKTEVKIIIGDILDIQQRQKAIDAQILTDQKKLEHNPTVEP